MTKEEINERIVQQAWALFHHWIQDSASEQTARFQNGLFELLKESDPNWHERINPPALGISVTDGIKTGEKVGG